MATYGLTITYADGSSQPEQYDDLAAMQVMGQVARVVELRPAPHVRITDDTGANVTVEELVVVARRNIPTGKSGHTQGRLKVWAQCAARIAVGVTASWIAAGAWWGNEVQLPLEPALLTALQQRAPNRNELNHFVNAARTTCTAADGTRPRQHNPQHRPPAVHKDASQQ